MDPSHRVVTETPLTELWNESGRIEAARSRVIGEPVIVRLLAQTQCRFVIADPGLPLRWVPAHERFAFWKTEVKPRLVPADVTAFHPEEYPGGYCYVATEWLGSAGPEAILLEKHH
jgi:hypothetical protein